MLTLFAGGFNVEVHLVEKAAKRRSATATRKAA
jgi:hypothetical protein